MHAKTGIVHSELLARIFVALEFVYVPPTCIRCLHEKHFDPQMLPFV